MCAATHCRAASPCGMPVPMHRHKSGLLRTHARSYVQDLHRSDSGCRTACTRRRHLASGVLRASTPAQLTNALHSHTLSHIHARVRTETACRRCWHSSLRTVAVDRNDIDARTALRRPLLARAATRNHIRRADSSVDIASVAQSTSTSAVQRGSSDGDEQHERAADDTARNGGRSRAGARRRCTAGAAVGRARVAYEAHCVAAVVECVGAAAALACHCEARLAARARHSVCVSVRACARACPMCGFAARMRTPQRTVTTESIVANAYMRHSGGRCRHMRKHMRPLTGIDRCRRRRPNTLCLCGCGGFLCSLFTF